MRHSLLILFLIPFLITKLNAQTKFGANIGLLNSYSRIENHFASIDTCVKKIGSKRGIKIGGFAEFKLKENWRMIASINFLLKGVKYFYDSLSIDYPGGPLRIEPLSQNIRTNYVEIEPLTVIYKAEKMHGFFAGVGPVAGMGIGGKVRLRPTGKLMARDAGPERKIKYNGERHGSNYSDSTFYLRPLEIGAHIILGYELRKSGISFLLSFYQSFSNISPDEKGVYRNSYLMFGASFKF